MHDTTQGVTMQVHQRKSQHLDVHVSQLTAWELQYDQLDAGLFEGQFVDIQLPGLQLFREHTNRALWQRGGLTPNAFGVAVMHSPPATTGEAASHTHMACVPDHEVNFRTPAHCTMFGMVVDQSLLQSACGAAIEELVTDADLLSAPDSTPTNATSARFAQQINGLINTILTQPSPFTDPRALGQIHDAALSYCLPMLEGVAASKLRPSAQARRRVVERAKALMMSEEGDDPPSLLDICKRLGVSQRKLTYCFQDVTGMSPHHCMRVIRLNAARRQLAGLIDGQEQSVRDIAHRWGFWHFGRFSVDYKHHFDESPSQTLRRRLA